MLRTGRSIAKWTRRVLGAFLALALIAVAVLAIRLSQGPIAVDRFKPQIEAALQPGDGSFHVAVGGTEIAWEGWRDGLRIRATGLRFERPDKTVLATIPTISLRVGVGALMRGEVALKEIKLWRPELRLVRTADGLIELGLKQTGKSAAPMLPNLLRALARDRRDKSGAPLGELESVSIVDGDLVVDDANLGREWRATHVSGSLSRDTQGIVASIGFDLAVDGRTVKFASRAIHRRADGTIRIGFMFKDLSPKVFASALGPMRALAWFDTPFGGAIELDARDTGRIVGARFDLRGTRGSLTIPGYYETPLEIADFLLTGALTQNGRRLDISKFEIRTKGPKLSTSGVFVGDEVNWSYNGTYTLSSVPAGDIRKYWPEGLKPRARDWVTANITAGTVEQIDLRIALRKRQHRTEPLVLDLAKGAFRFTGLSIRFMEHLPPVEKVDGFATFDDKNLKFSIERGELDGVKLTGGKVAILGFEKPHEDFIVEAPIEGKMSDILRVLDRKPLRFASALGVNPVAISANAKAKLSVRFLLGREVLMKDVDIRADAELTGFTWKKGLFGLDLADGRFKLGIDKKGMLLSGTARLGDEAATLQWNEAFGKTDGPRRTLNLKTRFRVETMAAAGFDIRSYMSGAFGADLKIIGTDDGRTQIDGVYDLKDAAYTTPGLPITKPRGMPAAGRSSVIMVNQRAVAVTRFSIESPAIVAAGSATFHNDGVTIRTMELTRLVAGRTDLRASIKGERDGSKTVRIEGNAFDITPILASRTASGDVPLPPFRASARLKRLYLARDRYVSDFVGDATFDGKRWRGIAMDAKVGHGTPLTLRLVESGQGRALQIATQDAGAALRALNVADTVAGGALVIRATADDRNPNAPFVGRADLRHFRVIRAPVMARLLAMASLEGIANLAASDQGVEFGTLTLPFRFRGGILEVTDGRAEGSQIGITVSGRLDTRKDVADIRGTIVPLYLLNSMVGKIPLLGDVIVGEKGSGLFAARYTVSGDLKNPRFVVN
ncbi:MAG: AsmA-like C-terminal domain-containing protein, partial [Rhodospirillaceae bacterium]|nr:AsmA-like C-terminal domain-containing protein [Rhodospirillaceae bacterium]